MLQSDYDHLIIYTKNIIKMRPQLQAEDIVNDVFLQFLETKEPFNLIKAERLVKRHPDLHEKSLREMGHVFFSRAETQKLCKDCKEVLPVAMFQILKMKTFMALASYCKPCANKRSYKAKVIRGVTKANSKKYRDTVWKKEREGLTDKYIIRTLVVNERRKNGYKGATSEEIKDRITKAEIKKYRENKLKKIEDKKITGRLNPVVFKSYEDFRKALKKVG